MLLIPLHDNLIIVPPFLYIINQIIANPTPPTNRGVFCPAALMLIFSQRVFLGFTLIDSDERERERELVVKMGGMENHDLAVEWKSK